MARTVHVIGAGLAGLSAAARLAQAGSKVALHEAGAQAGGRCRSYHDAQLGMTIDNGNHVILSGNRSALDYLALTGAVSRLHGPANAEFPFVDLADDGRWTLRISDGRFPRWIFSAADRVPQTRVRDYMALLHLMLRPGTGHVADVMTCAGPLYERLIEPVLLAALNHEPPQASARLAATLMRETLGAGGRNCRPLIARDGLSGALVDPVLVFLKGHDATVHFAHELHGIGFDRGLAVSLDFGNETVELEPHDAVIVAVPPNMAARLLPGLPVPQDYRAIANVHFRVERAGRLAPMTGVIHGTTQWLFAYPGRLSVTISAADALMAVPREELARKVWSEVARIAGLDATLPPWQVVRERRATIAADPGQERLRPPAVTSWRNVFLAGDWTDTGLPPTIESAIRSGVRAAKLAA
jgi:hydroxysqualene dehydroxylase